MSYQRDLTTLWQRVEALEQAQEKTEALLDDHGETLDRLEMAAAALDRTLSEVETS